MHQTTYPLQTFSPHGVKGMIKKLRPKFKSSSGWPSIINEYSRPSRDNLYSRQTKNSNNESDKYANTQTVITPKPMQHKKSKSSLKPIIMTKDV